MAHADALVVPIPADPRDLIKTARVIAKHMTALADALEKVAAAADESREAAEQLTASQAVPFKPTSQVVGETGGAPADLTFRPLNSTRLDGSDDLG
jgi:hypothetical protein